MADSTNSIQIQITDGVATTIAPNLVNIAGGADSAATALDRLQASLDGLDGSAITSITQRMNALPGNANNAANALDNLENKAITSAASFDALAVSIGGLDASLVTLTGTIQAVQVALTSGQSQLASFNTTATATQQVQQNLGNAIGGTSIGTRGLSSSFSLLEGRMMSGNRLAAQFIGSLSSLRPLMAAAFEVAGPIALAIVLFEIGKAIVEVGIDAENAGNAIQTSFRSMTDESRASNIQLAITVDKLTDINNKLEHKPANYTKLAIDELTKSAFDLATELDKDNQKIDALLAKKGNSIGEFGSALSNTETTGDTADKIKKMFADLTAKSEAYSDAIEAAGNEGDKQKQTNLTGDRNSVLTSDRTKDLADLQTQLKATTEAQKDFDDSVALQGKFMTAMLTPYHDSTANINLLSGAIAELNHQQKQQNFTTDLAVQQQRNAADEAAKDAAATAKQADRAKIEAMRDGLTALEAVQGDSLTVQVKYWQSQVSTTNAGSKAHQFALDEYNKAVAKKVEEPIKAFEDAQAKMQKLIGEQGLFGDALAKQKLTDSFKTPQMAQDNTQFSPDQQKALDNYADKYIAFQHQQEAEAGVYANVNDGAVKYEATQAAILDLIGRFPQYQSQYNAALAVATKNYEDSINPLNEISRSYTDQVELLGVYGDALTTASTVQSIDNQLRQKGYTLTEQGATALTQYIDALNQQKAVQGDINKLLDQNAGAVTKLVQEYQALQKAKQAGIITDGQERTQTLQLQLEYAKLQAQMGNTSALTTWQVASSKFLQGYTGIITGVDNLYSGLIDTIGNGLSNAIGRALFYGENLGDALKDVAREALSELISGMIKLGLQWVIQATIGRSLAATANAASIAQAAALSAAWATPAAFASVATMGSADAIGAASLATAVAASQALGAVTSAVGAGVSAAGGGGLATGGYVTGPGTSTSDSIPMWLSAGEAVINAAAVAQPGNRAIIDAMNSGARVVTSSVNMQVASAGASVGAMPRIVIEDHTTGAKIAYGGVSHDEVRMIARDVAQNEVKQGAPAVIASDIDNPNGKTSKAIRRGFQGGARRRTA